jgi:hypothetical protein
VAARRVRAATAQLRVELSQAGLRALGDVARHAFGPSRSAEQRLSRRLRALGDRPPRLELRPRPLADGAEPSRVAVHGAV